MLNGPKPGFVPVLCYKFIHAVEQSLPVQVTTV